MLNLQEVNNRTHRLGSHADTEYDGSERVSSLVFHERVLGSLGSSVIHDPGAEDEEEDREQVEGTAEAEHDYD